MISSDLVNKLFCSFAKLVSKLIGRELEFCQRKDDKLIPISVALYRLVEFLEGATEAFDDPIFKTLGVLEPGKLYCLQIDTGTTDLKMLTAVLDYLSVKGVRVLTIDKSMKFVSIPEGYEIKKEGKS